MLKKIMTGLLILFIGVLGHMLITPQGPKESIGSKLIDQGQHINDYSSIDCSFVCQVVNYGSKKMFLMKITPWE